MFENVVRNVFGKKKRTPGHYNYYNYYYNKDDDDIVYENPKYSCLHVR